MHGLAWIGCGLRAVVLIVCLLYVYIYFFKKNLSSFLLLNFFYIPFFKKNIK